MRSAFTGGGRCACCVLFVCNRSVYQRAMCMHSAPSKTTSFSKHRKRIYVRLTLTIIPILCFEEKLFVCVYSVVISQLFAVRCYVENLCCSKISLQGE